MIQSGNKSLFAKTIVGRGQKSTDQIIDIWATI